MSKEKEFTQDDLGEIVTITKSDGTYFEERIVQVFCEVCAASFIGIIREAGGFLGGHELFHKWEHNRGAYAAHGLTP